MHSSSQHAAHPKDAHMWTSTASPLVQRCARAGCRAMRQSVRGVWIEPTVPQPKEQKAIVQATPLWENERAGV
jgi:hypothetical protein